MTRSITKYSCFIVLSCLLLYFLFMFIFHLWVQIEPFNFDWNPTTDPNHVQHHQNEITYLNEWITILDKGNKPLESQQLKELLNTKETHLQWHTDRLPKPPLIKQTKFLFF